MRNKQFPQCALCHSVVLCELLGDCALGVGTTGELTFVAVIFDLYCSDALLLFMISASSFVVFFSVLPLFADTIDSFSKKRDCN